MAYDHLSTFTHPTDFRSLQCDVCRMWFCEDDIEVTLEDDDPNGMIGRCCQACANTARPKFEDAEALILYMWSLDSSEDDRMSSEGWGYVARFGRYLMFENSQGFVTSEGFTDAIAADKRFQDLYDDGMGAEEDDAWISEDRNGYAVSFAGKHCATFERLSRAKAYVSLEMRRTGFYPNVWYAGERGSVRRIDVW